MDSWKQLRADTIIKMIEKECLAGRIPMPTTRIPPKPRPAEFDHLGGSPLPTDEHGRIFVPSTTEPIVVATDEYGHVIYPIRDQAGRILSTDETGSVVNRLGEPIEFDDYGKPVGPDKEPLPTDESGAYIYPALDSHGKALPTDASKRPIYKAVDSDGKPLPTSEDGVPVDANGQPIPTDSSGRYIDPQGSPYPFDAQDNIIVGEKSKTTQTIDSTGFLLYRIEGPDDVPLPTDASGRYVDSAGRPIDQDESGRPLGPDGEPLPTSENGAYIYPKLGSDGKPLPTDSNKKPIYPIIRADGELLPTNEDGLALAPDGSVVPTDFAGRPLYTPGGKVLPSDEYGRIYFQGPDSETMATDETGAFVDSQGRPLPIEVDLEGKPIGAKVELDQIPSGQKPVVIDLFGRPLPTNEYGDAVYTDGTIVPTDTSGRPIGLDGSVMPVDHRGRYISDYMPDTTDLREPELLAEASTCDKVKEPANIIFMVESSDATRSKLNEIKLSLLDFIRRNVDWQIAKVGMVAYGSTVDVNMDIGNYQSYKDLEDSIRSLPFIGGTSSGDEHAMRTALQLFREKYDSDNGELIVHIYRSPIRLVPVSFKVYFYDFLAPSLLLQPFPQTLSEM